MRFRVGRHFGVAALYILASLGLSACSSTEQQQQGDENLEAQQGQEMQEGQEGQEEQGEQTASEEQSEQGQQGEEIAQGEEGQYQEEGEMTEEDTGEEVVDGGNSTESDLQEIISEMNGQGTTSGSEGNAALAQTAPTQNVPMNTTAAPVESAPLAAGPSAGPALPEVGSKMPYIVQSGDTLAKIATKIYGSNARWKEISNLTGLANPSRIYPGDVVYYTLDQSSVAFATAYDSVQRSSTQVQQGDTLATIARRVYGNSQAWKAIWRQNDDINNPDRLTVGMTVYYIQSGALSAALKEVRSQLATIANNIDSNASYSVSVAQNMSGNAATQATGYAAFNVALNVGA